MKLNKKIIVLIILFIESNNAHTIHESAYNSFLANMGYPEEVISLSKSLPISQNFDHYQTIGHDILLIVNYNYHYYQNNDFIKKLYINYFPNIVFYGPEPHPSVENYQAGEGVLGYMALALAMEKYPNYKGYLFIEDDCIIHFWNFTRFDKTKIWIADTNSRRVFSFGEHARWSHWNNVSWGEVAIKKVYDKLPSDYRARLHQNWGVNKVVGGLSDIVYFPAKYRTDVIELCKLCNQENVFIELAIPTIASCLDDKNNWEILSGYRYYLHENDDLSLDFIHPIKFSNFSNRNMVYLRFCKTFAKIMSLKVKNKRIHV